MFMQANQAESHVQRVAAVTEDCAASLGLLRERVGEDCADPRLLSCDEFSTLVARLEVSAVLEKK